VTTEVASVGTGKAGPREWLGLAVLALPTLLVSMDLTVLFLAVPSLSADLQPSATQLLWITDIYGFVMAGLLITMGTLGDRVGRRRVLLGGAAAFGGASLLAAMSSSADMLIATRALLGLAAATLLPSTLALIRNMFRDAAQRSLAIGLWTTTFSVGGLLGPLAGGWLVEHFGWASVFTMAVPVMLLLLALGPWLLPEFRSPQAARFDLLGAAQSLAATLGLVYGIKHIALDGLDPLALAIIAAAAALGWCFARRQLRLVHPLLDLRLLKRPALAGALAANVVAIFAWMGSLLFTAQYLQWVIGLSPLQAGVWTMPSAAASVAACLAAPAVVRWAPPMHVILSGLWLSVAGLCLLGAVPLASGLPIVVTASMLISAGVAVVLTLGTDLVMASAPPAQAGAASAFSETCTEIGGAFGIALLGSVGAWAYRHGLRDVDLSGVPAHGVDAARSTLAGSLEAASGLAGPGGPALRDTALAAFGASLQIAAAVAVLTVALASVGIWLACRRQAPRAHQASM